MMTVKLSIFDSKLEIIKKKWQITTVMPCVENVLNVSSMKTNSKPLQLAVMSTTDDNLLAEDEANELLGEDKEEEEMEEGTKVEEEAAAEVTEPAEVKKKVAIKRDNTVM